jgi:hypothetical protein
MSEMPQDAVEPEVLSATQKEKLNTLRRVLRIQIDGDWDDAMINTAFNNLEKLLDRLHTGTLPEETEDSSRKASKRAAPSGRRRGRRN